MLTASVLFERGVMPAQDALSALSLCSECGACEAHCVVGQPVIELLAEAREAIERELVSEATAVSASEPSDAQVQGSGRVIAIECDERSWHPALAARLKEPVAVYRTTAHLGLSSEHLQSLFSNRTVTTSCGRCQQKLSGAGVSFQSLTACVGEKAPSHWLDCRDGSSTSLDGLPACCGGRGPLIDSDPVRAQLLALDFAERLPKGPVAMADCACSAALRRAGLDGLSDPVDWLMAGN
jgi:ferredoxin